MAGVGGSPAGAHDAPAFVGAAAATSACRTGEAPKVGTADRASPAAAIRRHVAPCRTPEAPSGRSTRLAVVVGARLNRDRTPAEKPRALEYPVGATSAAAALRAVQRCVTPERPLKLPPDLSESREEIELEFAT